MKKFYLLFLFAALLIPGTVSAQSEIFGEKINQNFAEKIEPDLMKKAADAKTSPYDFMLICKRFGVLADKKAAPVVAQFLNVPEKAHSACMALQAMPFEEALVELRNAIPKVDNPLLKAGVINALGMRQDQNAVKILLPLIKDKNAVVAGAAHFALARIALPEYKNELLNLLNTKDPVAAKRASDLNLMYAEFLARNKKADDAEKVFFTVAEKAPFDFYRESAYFQILLRDSEATRKLMAQWLIGSDKLKYEAALRAAQFVKNDAVTEIFIAACAKVAPERMPALIAALGDQKNPKAQNTLLNALNSENESIKTAAVNAMKVFANRAYFPKLVKAAISGDDTIHKSSVTVIEMLDDDINVDILKLLQQDEASQILAVELIGLRKIANGQKELFARAQSGSKALRIAAIKALGDMADQDQFAWLVKTVVSEKDPELVDAAKIGLKSACGQILNRNAAAKTLAKGANELKANKELRLYLFQMLAVLGGSAARDEITKAAVSNDREACDLATQVLGKWMDPDVAPILLQLANVPRFAYANRALRGYLRLARQFAMPIWMRSAMVRDALASPACGNNEKEIAATIVKQYGLDLKKAETPEQKQLRNIEILSVVYGVFNDPQKQKNVTDKIRDRFFNSGTLSITIPEGYNQAFDGDPAPNIAKQIRIDIRFRNSGKMMSITQRENAPLKLPAKP